MSSLVVLLSLFLILFTLLLCLSVLFRAALKHRPKARDFILWLASHSCPARAWSLKDGKIM